MDDKWKQYKIIVGYGIGQYYETVKEELFHCVKLTYLCDKKMDDIGTEEYDGLKTITRKQLFELKETLVIVTVGSKWIYDAIRKELECPGLTVVHVDEVIGKTRELNGERLKAECPSGKYEDLRGNVITFDETLPDNIRIVFVGRNSTIHIGKNLMISHLYIKVGNNGVCRIGENTEIISGSFHISGAKLIIGDDCLFSTEVILRTHDGHHIFDVDTKERVNLSKDIMIGDQVWIGQRVMLLGGAQVGTGSIVGANAVTSGKFGEHQIIAGVPARCVRENVCWSKDDTDYFDRSCFMECKSQEALKYL